jgi:hypothetical protein
MTLRETRFDDYAGVASVLVRNGLRTPTPEQWAYFWANTPGDELLSGIPMGWVLEDETSAIVGTFRNVALAYDWNRRPVRVVVASAWAVDPAHRRWSLGLATEFFRQRAVDVLLNTTAVAETSGKAFLAFGAERIPQPSYTERLLWITGYAGFAAGLMRERGLPAAPVLKYPLGAGMWALDRVNGAGRASDAGGAAVRHVPDFDDRFDRFWDMVRRKSNRLRAVRDRATLAWRFALEHERPLIVALEDGADVAAYAVLVRRDQVNAGLRRLEVADLQALDDDPQRVRALMAGVLGLARDLDIHLVAMSGQNESKRQALAGLKPYRKTAAGWPLYYKARDAELNVALRSPDAWDLSPFDGDILWSGVFGGAAPVHVTTEDTVHDD